MPQPATMASFSPRVVITHDFMETYGGAERVTQEMARAFPDAPVVALLGRRSVARRMGIEDRFSTQLPGRNRVLDSYRLMAPVLPAVAAAARLPEADVVLSSSYGFAHHFRSPGCHISYCHSPLRFAWSMTGAYEREYARSRPSRVAFRALAASMRAVDRHAARSVDRWLTQSPYVAEQIGRFYGREASVIGAPVDVELFRPGPDAEAWRADPYFLLSGRLVEPYKRAVLAVEAFRALPQHRLVVAGDGPALPVLREMATPNVEFVGNLEDHDLVPLMQRCTAALFPSRDDFGLIPVEVMACGRPVVAYAGGGALHTVLDGVTGSLFPIQTADAVRAAVEAFRPDHYDPDAVRRHAEGWSAVAFRRRLVEEVTGALG